MPRPAWPRPRALPAALCRPAAGSSPTAAACRRQTPRPAAAQRRRCRCPRGLPGRARRRRAPQPPAHAAALLPRRCWHCLGTSTTGRRCRRQCRWPGRAALQGQELPAIGEPTLGKVLWREANGAREIPPCSVAPGDKGMRAAWPERQRHGQPRQLARNKPSQQQAPVRWLPSAQPCAPVNSSGCGRQATAGTPARTGSSACACNLPSAAGPSTATAPVHSRPMKLLRPATRLLLPGIAASESTL